MTNTKGIKQHGIKQNFQVLLDPNRAALLVERAKEQGKKPTAYARELLYEALQMDTPRAAYAAAEAKDVAARKEAVYRQVTARVAVMKSKKLDTAQNVS